MTEQPMPRTGKQDVTPHARAEFLRVLAEREAMGLAHYGTPLQTFNGRSAMRDAKEELVDLWQYLIQIEMEAHPRVPDLEAQLAEARAWSSTLADAADDVRAELREAEKRIAELEAVERALADGGITTEGASFASTADAVAQTIAELRRLERAIGKGTPETASLLIRIAELEAGWGHCGTCIHLTHTRHPQHIETECALKGQSCAWSGPSCANYQRKEDS